MKANLGQSINVADNKEFREFVLFGRDDITDVDLPHRTKLTELINKEYETQHAVLVKELAVPFDHNGLLCALVLIMLYINSHHWAVSRSLQIYGVILILHHIWGLVSISVLKISVTALPCCPIYLPSVLFPEATVERIWPGFFLTSWKRLAYLERLLILSRIIFIADFGCRWGC
jgi:hypothetical protein